MNSDANHLPSDHTARLRLAMLSLQGLSVGDAFGERFIGNETVARLRLELRDPPPPPWFWTDDTAMAISIVRALRDRGSIDGDQLAALFTESYRREPDRGYGGTARRILRAMEEGVTWENASTRAFDGMGSYGNGGAMRAGPLGAYFAGDYRQTAEHARASAQVTHAHEEGQTGAIAVAVAAAWAAQADDSATGEQMLDAVLEWTPEGETRTGLSRVRKLGLHLEPEHMAGLVGCGWRVSAQDTVPYAVWCAARSFRNYQDALWQTASALGDVDTTCAIVGSIVALSAHAENGIPAEWLAAREALPADFNN